MLLHVHTDISGPFVVNGEGVGVGAKPPLPLKLEVFTAARSCVS